MSSSPTSASASTCEGPRSFGGPLGRGERVPNRFGGGAAYIDRVRRTKIVATIGPASRDPDTLVRMIEAGMDVARFNFSHGNREFHAENARAVRGAAEAA